MAKRRLAAIGGGIAVAAIAAGVLVWRAMPDPTRAPSPAELHALADTACPRVTAAFFYRIDKDGKTSYLLGTRHAGVALAKFPPAVAQAFRSSRIAVFESIVHDVFETSPGIAIDEALGDVLWDHYRELVGDDVAERLRHRTPLEAARPILLLYEDTTQAIDRELEQLAREQGKELVGLEDAARTAQVGDLVLGAPRLKQIVRSVTDRAQLERAARSQLAAYCAGTTKLSAADAALGLDERNHAWLPRLDDVFGRGGAFVTVGVLHVIDRGGLIELLRARGYAVTHVD